MNELNEILKILGPGYTRALAVSPDGETVATAHGLPCDGKINVWRLSNGQKIYELNSDTNGAECIEFVSSGTRFLSGHFEHFLVWDASSGSRVKKLRERDSSVEYLAISTDGRRLASTGQVSDHISLWDLEKLEVLRQFRNPNRCYGISFSPDGSSLVVAGSRYPKGVFHTWNVESGELVSQIETGFSMPLVSFSRDMKRFAFIGGSRNETVFIGDWNEKRVLRKLCGHTDCVLDLDFSTDGRRLASSQQWSMDHRDASVRVWDVESGNELAEAHLGGSIDCVKFTPDGSKLISGRGDYFHIWRVPA